MTDQTSDTRPDSQPTDHDLNINASTVNVSGDVVGGNKFEVKQYFFNLLGRGPYHSTPQQRRDMLQLVENLWIRDALEQSLHRAVVLELGLEQHREAVERPFNLALRAHPQPDRPLPEGTRIIQVFDEANGTLLILGAPGAGKTTTLLELTRDLLARARMDAGQRIPVVLPLASWAQKQKPLAEWLVDELVLEYKVGLRLARAWVEEDALLLLLDGLDEVKPEAREACVEAINAFRLKQGLTPIVVCSRSADYQVLTTRLQLNAAVQIQPLTPAQAEAYLLSAGDELRGAREAFARDAALRELASTPLMLSILALAYRGVPAEDIAAYDNLELLRRHLFDTYVQNMLERRTAPHAYASHDTVRWLGWLAHGMLAHNQSVFLIEGLRPSWLASPFQRRLHHFVFVATITLLTAALLGGFLASRVDPSLVLFGWLGGGGMGALTGVYAANSFSRHEMVERLKWSWRGAAAGSVGGALFGLVMGIFWISVMHVTEWLGQQIDWPLHWDLSDPFKWLPASVLIGIVWFMIADGLNTASVETHTQVGQGLRDSVRNGFIGALVAGGAMLLILSLTTFNPATIILFAGEGGLLFGWAAVFNHYTLRFMLWRSGALPWDYIKFLNSAADLILLRRVGGGYQFIHRSLQEYFAALDDEQIAADAPPN